MAIICNCLSGNLYKSWKEEKPKLGLRVVKECFQDVERACLQC